MPEDQHVRKAAEHSMSLAMQNIGHYAAIRTLQHVCMSLVLQEKSRTHRKEQSYPGSSRKKDHKVQGAGADGLLSHPCLLPRLVRAGCLLQPGPFLRLLLSQLQAGLVCQSSAPLHPNRIHIACGPPQGLLLFTALCSGVWFKSLSSCWLGLQLGAGCRPSCRMTHLLLLLL